jgi:hypothetical protein
MPSSRSSSSRSAIWTVVAPSLRGRRDPERALVEALVEQAHPGPIVEQHLQRLAPLPEEHEQRAARAGRAPTPRSPAPSTDGSPTADRSGRARRTPRRRAGSSRHRQRAQHRGQRRRVRARLDTHARPTPTSITIAAAAGVGARGRRDPLDARDPHRGRGPCRRRVSPDPVAHRRDGEPVRRAVRRHSLVPGPPPGHVPLPLRRVEFGSSPCRHPACRDDVTLGRHSRSAYRVPAADRRRARSHPPPRRAARRPQARQHPGVDRGRAGAQAGRGQAARLRPGAADRARRRRAAGGLAQLHRARADHRRAAIGRGRRLRARGAGLRADHRARRRSSASCSTCCSATSTSPRRRW